MIVNGLWYGSELGELEKLCIDSWIENGYKFRLWLYEDIEVPKDVIVKNKFFLNYRVNHMNLMNDLFFQNK